MYVIYVTNLVDIIKPLKLEWFHAGAELGLFILGAKINIIRYNICFNLLYMSCETKPT